MYYMQQQRMPSGNYAQYQGGGGVGNFVPTQTYQQQLQSTGKPKI